MFRELRGRFPWFSCVLDGGIGQATRWGSGQARRRRGSPIRGIQHASDIGHTGGPQRHSGRFCELENQAFGGWRGRNHAPPQWFGSVLRTDPVEHGGDIGHRSAVGFHGDPSPAVVRSASPPTRGCSRSYSATGTRVQCSWTSALRSRGSQPHTAVANGHRGWNEHPRGGQAESGISPRGRSRWAALPGRYWGSP